MPPLIPVIHNIKKPFLFKHKHSLKILMITLCSAAAKEQGILLGQTAGCYSGGDWDQQVTHKNIKNKILVLFLIYI